MQLYKKEISCTPGVRWGQKNGGLLWCALAGLAGLCLTYLYAHWNGPYYFFTSAVHLSCAANLAAGKGFIDYAGFIYTDWPPLFPSMIAFFTLLGATPVEAARFINAAAFGLAVAGFCHLLRQNLHSRIFMALGCLSILAAVPPIRLAMYIMSESAFAALLVFFVIFFQRCLDKPSWRRLAAASVIAALATLQRHFGLITVITGAGIMLLAFRQKPWKWLLAHCSAFVGASTLPIGLWWLHNRLTAGSIKSPVDDNPVSFGAFFSKTLDTITGWLCPLLQNGPLWIRLVIISTVMGGLIAVLARTGEKKGLLRQPVQWTVFWTSGVFFAAYVSAVVAATVLFTDNEEIDRYLAPAWFALFFPLWVLVDRAAEQLQNKSILGFQGRHWIILGSAVWLLLCMVNTCQGIPIFGSHAPPRFPITGGADRIKGARAMRQWLLANPLEDPVYSNQPPLLELYCGKKPLWVPTHKKKEKLIQVAGEMAGWGKPVRLVQFETVWIIDLPQVFNYEPIALFPEGGVYDISIKKPEQSWVLANFMGASSLERRDLGEAERYLSMALGLNPQSIPVHYNMACLRSLQFRRDEAMNWLKKAVDLGFADAALLTGDPDLDNIRKAPGFANLLQAAQAPGGGLCFATRCFDK